MLENLQANILKPHGRKESDHLLVRFAAGPETVRAWIREFARREATSARKQIDETGNYHDHGTRGGLVAGFALSAAGYGALGLLPEDFGGSGQSFREGMKRRAFSVIARNRDPPSNEWEGPYQGDIHALVSLSHDSADELAAKTREVSEGLRAIAEVLTIERGTVLAERERRPDRTLRLRRLAKSAPVPAGGPGCGERSRSRCVGSVRAARPGPGRRSVHERRGFVREFPRLPETATGCGELQRRREGPRHAPGGGRVAYGCPRRRAVQGWDACHPPTVGRPRTGEQLRVPRARPCRESMSVPRPHPEGESARSEPVPESGGGAQSPDRATGGPLWRPTATTR